MDPVRQIVTVYLRHGAGDGFFVDIYTSPHQGKRVLCVLRAGEKPVPINFHRGREQHPRSGYMQLAPTPL